MKPCARTITAVIQHPHTAQDYIINKEHITKITLHGGRPGEKGAGGIREGGEEGAGSGRKGENYATLSNILQSKKYKEAGANKYRAGTGIKRYGKRKV